MDLISYAQRGRKLLWRQTCSIQRSIGVPGDFPEPTNVHTRLKCSYVYELSEEEKEKGFLATVSRPLKLFTDLPDSGVIQEHDVVVVNSKNYLVVKAQRWPHENPAYYELIVDYKRGL